MTLTTDNHPRHPEKEHRLDNPIKRKPAWNRDWEKIAQGDVLSVSDVRNAIRKGNRLEVINLTKNETYETEHPMTPRQVEMVLTGSLINLVRQKSHSLE